MQRVGITAYLFDAICVMWVTIGYKHKFLIPCGTVDIEAGCKVPRREQNGKTVCFMEAVAFMYTLKVPFRQCRENALGRLGVGHTQDRISSLKWNAETTIGKKDGLGWNTDLIVPKTLLPCIVLLKVLCW